MKNSYILFLVLCFCALTSHAQDSIIKQHSPLLKKIFKSDTSVFRGYEFGDHRDSIKKYEDATFDGEGKDFVVYKLILSEKQTAEIMYTFDENSKAIQFGVSFIENVNVSVEELMLDDFQGYFNQRYGSFAINAKNDEVWTSAEGYVLEMGDSTQGKGDLLEIEIEIYQKK